jgi:hypothetical protein
VLVPYSLDNDVFLTTGNDTLVTRVEVSPADGSFAADVDDGEGSTGIGPIAPSQRRVQAMASPSGPLYLRDPVLAGNGGELLGLRCAPLCSFFGPGPDAGDWTVELVKVDRQEHVLLTLLALAKTWYFPGSQSHLESERPHTPSLASISPRSALRRTCGVVKKSAPCSLAVESYTTEGLALKERY